MRWQTSGASRDSWPEKGVTNMRAVLIMNIASGTSTMATTEGTSEEHQEAILATLVQNHATFSGMTR
jgi:hypothetical protein